MHPGDEHVFVSPVDVARAVADAAATAIGIAIQERSKAFVAFSGGRTPWFMLECLARHPVRWEQVHIFQVDERVAPDGSPDRNLANMLRSLGPDVVARCAIDAIPIPTTATGADADAILHDLDVSAEQYANTIHELCDDVIDFVHLGLGPDGHTASLVPNDAVLDVDDRLVAVTEPYMGHRRLTLTYPALSAARAVVWMVDGTAKAQALAQLRAGDTSIPAARVVNEHMRLFCDHAAMHG